MHSYYPTAQQVDNYVPPEFELFMDNQVQDWDGGGFTRIGESKKGMEPNTPLVVFLLGIEPSKPRALWDGRYVNEFAETSPFQWTMRPRWQKWLGKEHEYISSK